MNLQDAWTFNLAGSYDFGFMKTYLATQYFKDARDAGSVLDYVGFFDEDSVFNNNEGDVKFNKGAVANTGYGVHEITIIPRGQAGGYTMYLPEKDRSYVTKGEMFEDIVSSLGGRVAEQLILEDISTGASNDLQQATNIARQMITRYGFSERLGPVVYGTSQEETFLGRDFGQGKGYSETTAAEIDSETRDIIDEAYETCRRTLTEHIDQLHALAKALMEREKLNEEQFNTIMAGGTLPPCEDAKPEQAQPDQTVQPAPVQPAEPAETAERAEPAEQAEPAQPEMPQPDAPEQQD